MAYMCTRSITRECDACGNCKNQHRYYCPVCGEEVFETIFITYDGEILGCENCVLTKEPSEVFDDEIN